MARVNLPASQPFYAAAAQFVDVALRGDGSLFAPGTPIWSAETIEKLWHDFVEKPDVSQRGFEAKFKDQLASSDADTVLLAGELLFMFFAPVNGIKSATKRSQIRQILSWATTPITTSIPPEIDRALDYGIAKASTAYLLGKPFQLWFLLETVREWKRLPTETRTQALADPWAFKQFLFALPIEFAYAQRELLLHIVHPDTFEATMARDHKPKIVRAFAHLIDNIVADVDLQLLQIRRQLEPQYGVGFHFYDEPQRSIWLTPVKNGTIIDEPEDDDDSIDEGETRTLIELTAWQASFSSENELARHVAQDYPQWLRETWGDVVEVQPYAERLLHVFLEGKRVLELSLRRVRGVYVLLFYTHHWDTVGLKTRLSRPRSAYPREEWGFRFVMSNKNDYELLKTMTTQTFNRMLAPQPALLPHTLGEKLRSYVELAAHLDASAYTPQQIVDRLGQIIPPIVALAGAPDAAQLVRDLLHLRLLKPLDNGNYRRWPELGDATVGHMLRYAALTLLLPDGEEYDLPALDAPFDGLPYPPASWPLGGALLPWYEEAGLVRRNENGTWQSLPGVLEPLDATTTTARTLNTFLLHLRSVRASQRGLAPLDDAPLQILPPAVLEERISEIQRELLIDRDTILRVYRSLLAGQHVILSGPPGTGKTHLARILPRILWRDAEDTIVLRMPASPDLPPTADPVEELLRREGYTVEVVTATEDWGVRHVVGGIAPQLQQNSEGKTLIYGIRHGHLTRAVLNNYAEYDGEHIPPLDRLRRRELTDGQAQYRGHWLVIDEFTRAQVDAAFGSLLTTLGGQRNPTLAVPTEQGDEQHIPLPRDFRLIGTLNSFDRHFLNQMSEAMKRRFAFIDVLPPGRSYAVHEQATAIYRALLRLRDYGFNRIDADPERGNALLPGILETSREEVENEQPRVRYRLRVEHAEAQAALNSFWRMFSAIRLYRQLGTAQAEAVYAALITGHEIGMSWSAALDSALADTLADQLQVLARDEQRVLLAAIEFATNTAALHERITQILSRLPGPRQSAHLIQLKTNETSTAAPIDDMKLASLTTEQIFHLFGQDTSEPAMIPTNGLFANRLRAFANERGL